MFQLVTTILYIVFLLRAEADQAAEHPDDDNYSTIPFFCVLDQNGGRQWNNSVHEIYMIFVNDMLD